jgi:hypothetical protein
MAIIIQQQGVGERYRDFDMFPPSHWAPVNEWHATHKDYDGDEDDRTLSAKSRADLIDAIDQWHWEQSVEPLLVAAERLLAVFDQQRMTAAERIIAGISDAGLRTEGNAAIEALRAAAAKARGDA